MGCFTFARSNIAFRAARKFSSRSPIFEPSAIAVLIYSVAAVSDRRMNRRASVSVPKAFGIHRNALQIYSPSTFCIE